MEARFRWHRRPALGKGLSGGAPPSAGGELSLAIEEASLRAWPAIEELRVEGWVLRHSEGFTGRANSVQAMRGSRRPVAERVSRCESWYRERELPCLFRLTPFSEPGLDEVLAERGYARVKETRVLHRTARAAPPDPVARVPHTDVRSAGLHDWLRTYAGLSGMPAAPAPLQRIVERIGPESMLAVLWTTRPRRPVACGLAVLDGGLVGLFDIVVDPDLRRRGYGGELVERLVTWGHEGGADDVYLQVTEDNVPALAMYAKLGFARAYDYWYRSRPR